MKSDKFSSMFAYLLSSASRFPDREALVIRRNIKKEVITYSQFIELLCKTERFFSAQGINRGDKILFWAPNCPEYTLLLCACFSFSRIAVPIDYRTSARMIAKVIKKTSPKWAFVSKQFHSVFLKKKGLEVFYIEDLLSKLIPITLYKTVDQLLQNKIYSDLKQISEIVFTSGTTGTPKGVVITQGNLLTNLASVDPSLPNLDKARIISILPLSHMFEQIVGMLLPLGQSATIFYLPRINSFRMLQAFSEYRPTHQIFVPQLLKIIWEKIEDRARASGEGDKLQALLKIAPYLPMFVKRLVFRQIQQIFGGRLKIIACGGAPLDPEIGENFLKVGFPVVEGYGATEVTAIATFTPLEKLKIGSCGKTVPGVAISIDSNNEIYIKSQSQSMGYYKDEIRTKKTFTNLGYKSGDIGEFDKDGYLYIKGRDVFKIVLPSGEKIFVEDLEKTIKKDKRIKEMCVAAEHLKDGDRVHAYFILRDQVKDKLRDIVAGINRLLESKQQITSYSIWEYEDFPRTPTLKIDRKMMSDFVNSHGKSIASIKLQEVKTDFADIIDILCKLSKKKREEIKETDILASDLSLDSISRIELVAMAEEYLGLFLDESKISGETTVSDLKKMVGFSPSINEVKLPTWQFTWWGKILHDLVSSFIIYPLHSFIIKINYPKNSSQKIKPGTIIIFNHPGVADAFCIMRFLKKQGRKDFFLNATDSVWQRSNILARLLELTTKAIPLYLSGFKFIRVMQLNSDLLDRGYNLLLAPQGRIQRKEKEDHFLPGIGFMLKELDKAVYIIKIKGYRSVWPAPPTDVIDSSIFDLLPGKRGSVDLMISGPIYRNWNELGVEEITSFLEKKYQSL